ncbi:MAG: chaperonin GroEL, partial [Simkaniaceae bacterium]|nr:chaperonin GroEL [Simkaniaceae bacterium]
MTSPKSIIFEETAREKLKNGIDTLADIVGITLGPKGHNVGLQAPFGSPKITNDGASIVRDVELKDQYENMGVELGKEVVNKVRELAGDGSTTAIILLRALVTEGVKSIAAGASPILVKRGMEKALAEMLTEIEKISKPIKNAQDIESIATAAASGNVTIGKLIAEAFEKVGKNGVVSIEEGKGTETTLDVVEGMEFDRGYLSAYFCTDREKLTIDIENPAILLTDKKIASIHEILPLLQAVATSGKELLIIAEDIEGDALSTLVVNKLRGTLKVSAVKAPSFGDRRKAILEDLAILTGGTVISDEKGMDLKTATEDLLGTAEQVTITKETTTIIGGGGADEKLKARLAEIEREIDNAASEYDKEKL